MFNFEKSAFKFVKPLISRQSLKSQFASDPSLETKSTTTSPPLTPPPYVEDVAKPLHYEVQSPDLFLKLEQQIELGPESEVKRKSLSFDEVPGPALLRHLAKVWKVLPAFGTQVTASTVQYLLSAGTQLSWSSNSKIFRWLLDEYGPVVRLHGPFGGDVVVLSRPEHAGVVFENEGRYPIRSCLDCVEKYRLEHRRYKQAGPFLMYGPEWEKVRKSIERPLKNCITQQYDEIEQSCDELVTRILRIRNRQDEVPHMFRNEICKWALECMSCVILNKRLGFLDPLGLSVSSEPGRILEGLNKATGAIRKCESGLHLWKFVKTPSWKELVKHCDTIDAMMNKYINKAQDNLGSLKISNVDSLNEVSFIETLLLKEDMAQEDVLTILLDMMLIGVNSITHSVSFLLYHLARYPRVQRKLFEEIIRAPTQLSHEDLKEMKYLQACIKESLRLKPPMPVLSRVLSRDLIIYNYRIPSGTYVLIASNLASMKEEHFEDAEKFKPERWLDSEMYMDASPFATIPYGHGPKACVAKELAQMQIALLTFKLMRKFRVEYHYGDIKSSQRFLADPDRPLKLRFIDRL